MSESPNDLCGGTRQTDDCPCTSLDSAPMRRWVFAGRWSTRRVVLGFMLCLLPCWLVVASLAAAGEGGRAVGRGVAARVAAPPIAKLSVKVASVAVKGDDLAGSATFVDMGRRPARSSTAALAWRVHGSSDGLVQLGRFRVPALAAGRRDIAHFRVAVPTDASGSYEVNVCADVLSQVGKFSAAKDCRRAGVV